MPVSTRLWTLAVVVAVAFCGWAWFWPPTGYRVETVPARQPAYPESVTLSPAAPNPADPAWARPLFFNDRSPRVADVGGEGTVNGETGNSFLATLTGIVRSPGLNLATLTPTQSGKPLRVQLGAEVTGQPGWRLVDLGPRSATFRNGEQSQVLKLNARDAINTPPPAAAPPAPGSPSEAAAMTSASAAAEAAATQDDITTEQRQQVEAIRRRIEERRKQMRQPSPPAPPAEPH
ncbi:hypothetical protein EBB59_09555 [Lysobacter pythonis]|uniref:General secretion pathway protein GspN n=2 Tax=Solilutibacter pythonis TaxID=2483112 RepID=A0A3M2HPA2_9GAMM|nr:hypothetical protein EBB59_09555 [Lysobacter pythonis]